MSTTHSQAVMPAPGKNMLWGGRFTGKAESSHKVLAKVKFTHLILAVTGRRSGPFDGKLQ